MPVCETVQFHKPGEDSFLFFRSNAYFCILDGESYFIPINPVINNDTAFRSELQSIGYEI